MPQRALVAANLWYAGDGRDLPLNLSEICLASAMEVADAIVRESPIAAGAQPVSAG